VFTEEEKASIEAIQRGLYKKASDNNEREIDKKINRIGVILSATVILAPLWWLMLVFKSTLVRWFSHRDAIMGMKVDKEDYAFLQRIQSVKNSFLNKQGELRKIFSGPGDAMGDTTLIYGFKRQLDHLQKKLAKIH